MILPKQSHYTHYTADQLQAEVRALEAQKQPLDERLEVVRDLLEDRNFKIASMKPLRKQIQSSLQDTYLAGKHSRATSHSAHLDRILDQVALHIDSRFSDDDKLRIELLKHWLSNNSEVLKEHLLASALPDGPIPYTVSDVVHDLIRMVSGLSFRSNTGASAATTP